MRCRKLFSRSHIRHKNQKEAKSFIEKQTKFKSPNIMDSDNDANIANEIISQLIESVYNALQPTEDLVKELEGEATKECILDESIEIVLQIIEDAFNAIGMASTTDAELTTATTNETILNVCVDEVNEMIEKVVELAYNACADELVSKDEQKIFKNKFDDETTCDCVDLQSDASFIVECIDCINDTNDIQTTDAEPHEYDNRIAVERIEICTNEKVIPSIVPETKESTTEEPDNQHSGTHGIDPSVDNSMLCEAPPNECSFYSDEVLQQKGYATGMVNNDKSVINLAIPSDALTIAKVRCSGLASDLTENELVPMLEKCGRIFEIRFVGGAEAGVVNVTYMTKRERDNAIKMLNGRIVHGKTIKVEVLQEKTQLIVRPIATEARKSDLFNHFSKMTKYLVQIYLTYEDRTNTLNRNYCFLSYRDYDSANEARKIISKMKYNGETVFCDWSINQPGIHQVPYNVHKRVRLSTAETPSSSHKLYMNHLRPGLTVADLRKIFSLYGELTEVDKSDGWASLRFRYLDDARRAFQNVDKTKLGNENFEISRNELREHNGLSQFVNRRDTTAPRISTNDHRYGQGNRIMTSRLDSNERRRNERQRDQRKAGSSGRNGYRTGNMTSKNDSNERCGDAKTLNIGSNEQSGNNYSQVDTTTTTTTTGENADQIFFLN